MNYLLKYPKKSMNKERLIGMLKYPSNNNLVVKQFIETERCTGHCCKMFQLGNKTKLEVLDIVRYNNKNEKEFNSFFDMLEEVGYKVFTNGNFHEPTMYFTCKKLDKETGNCTIYEDRPEVCRGYPEYGSFRECKYKNCTREVKWIETESKEI